MSLQQWERIAILTLHLSLFLCLRSPAVLAATPENVLTSTMSEGLSGDVTETLKAADKPLSQLATKMSAGRDLDLSLPQLLPCS